MSAVVDSTTIEHRLPGGPGVVLAGTRAILPLTAGLIPFGLAIGASAHEAGLPWGPALASAVLLYGGSAQVVAQELVTAGASTAVILTGILAVNARLLLYGAGLAPHLRGTSVAYRTLASYLLVDPVFVVATEHHATAVDPRERRHFYLGAAVTLWVVWVTVNLAGVLAGSVLPAAVPATLLLPLALTGLSVRSARARTGVIAAVVAAAGALALHGLPHDTGFVAAGLLGVLVATWLSGRVRS